MRKKFTLIELLVVIAIIAILAALLLPALNKARQTALANGCRGNQKQVLNALFMYFSDYGDTWTPRATTGAGGDGKWNQVLFTWNYLPKNSNTVMCPGVYPFNFGADPTPGSADYLTLGMRKMHTYATPAAHMDGPFAWGGFLFKKVSNPASYFFTADALHVNRFNSNGLLTQLHEVCIRKEDTNYSSLFGAHDGLTNTGYLDGHVAAAAPADICRQAIADFSSAGSILYPSLTGYRNKHGQLQGL
jgi:prepilin-type N-terminal cleavage/methylation domain-containing protein/prepilin-type processing-associated H-X9-DG protein